MASTLASATKRSRPATAEWWRVIVTAMGPARLDSRAAASSCREVSSLTRLAAPARFLDPPPITRSRARSWTSAGSSMTLDASLTVTRPCSTASRTAGAAGLSSDSTLAAWATVLLLTRSSSAASPWVKERCKFAQFSLRGRPGADDAESLWATTARRLSSRCRRRSFLARIYRRGSASSPRYSNLRSTPASAQAA